MSSPKYFRSLTDKMQLDIIAWARQRLRGSEIHKRLVLKYGAAAPASRQTVYNFLERRREQGEAEADDAQTVWSVGAMAEQLSSAKDGRPVDIGWEDVRLILRVQRAVAAEAATRAKDDPPVPGVLQGLGLTVAEARWVARLGRFVPETTWSEERPKALIHLFFAAVWYLDIEELCRIRGIPFNTWWLDRAISPMSADPFKLIPGTAIRFERYLRMTTRTRVSGEPEGTSE